MMDGAPPQDPGHGAPPPPPPAAPPPSSPPPSAGGTVSENRNLWIVLSYLGLLALIPLLVEKDDAEVQWHAKNGLVLTAAEFVGFIGLWIIIGIVGAISGGLGCILGLIWPIVMLAVLVLHIMCIVKGLGGNRLVIPGVSQFVDRF
jgi:uncharacterized membrane protein